MPASERSPDEASDAAPADRLDQAGALVRWALLLTAAGVAVVALGAPVRGAIHPDPRPALMERLPKLRPALEPAGRVARVPASHPAVVPHFVPGLSGLVPDPSEALVGPP